MSKTYCKIVPDKGADLFRRLSKQLGRTKAVELWEDVISHLDFLEDYKDTLTLDSEGIPTFESIMANPYVKLIIGKDNVRKSLEALFTTREDTRENFRLAVNDALVFNKLNKEFVAIVERKDDKLQVKLLDKNQANLSKFTELFGVTSLNDSITLILGSIGISPTVIKEAGIEGITDFSKAKTLANDLIRIADRYEGEYALSEEFAHLCLEVFKDNPLVLRTKNTLGIEEVKQVLGDLYETYAERYDNDESRLVDEAMGHLLLDSFFKVNNAPKKSQTLFGRLVSLIKNFFRKLNSNDLRDALYTSKSAMDEVAKGILSGDLLLSREKISSISRKDILYSLTLVLDAIGVLDKISDNEVKMAKIIKAEDTSFIEEIVSYQLNDADTALGICRYLEHTLHSLENIERDWEHRTAYGDLSKFAFLRHEVRDHYRMYYENILHIQELLTEAEESREDELNLLSRLFSEDGVTFKTILDLVDLVSALNNKLLSRYFKVATTSFAHFAKPFYGKNLINPFKQGMDSLEDDKGFEYYLKHADNDVSWFDTWLSAMGSSSDVMLLVLDLIVKNYKDLALQAHIEASKKIQSAHMKAKNAGVTDFKFMYLYIDGKKTKDYISLELADALPEAQREYYNTFMGIKASLDNFLDDPNAYSRHVILIKKDNTYGGLGLLAQGKFAEAGEYFANLVFEKSYDDLLGFGKASVDSEGYMLDSFGDRILDEEGNPVKPSKENLEKYSTRRTLKGFDGKEYMLVPKYYLHDITNLDDVSEDPTGSLIAYSFMAHNYKEMNSIVDAMETGRDILSRRKVKETRGKKLVKEALSYGGILVESDVELEYSKTNIAKKIDMFFNSLIYGRYLRDEGVWHFLGKDVNKQKVVSTILGASAHVQLGFNGLAQTANVANGIAMINIEAAAGKYFKPRTLLKADNEYKNLLKDYLGELDTPIKKSKLALIMEYFNVKLNAHENAKVRYDKAMLKKIFGPDAAFIGQEAGDHWLYNRVALAYLMETKGINKNTLEEVSLYDSLIVTVDENGVGRLSINPDVEFANIPRNIFSTVGRRIANVNHRLFGIYNQDDLVAALLVALGRLAIQYRKYLMPALGKRFKASLRNLVDDEWEEGYYRTYGYFLLGKIARGLKRSKFLLIANWEQSPPEVRENIRRARMEIGQFLGVVAGVFLLGLAWPDKKNRPWLVKFLDYQLRRLQTELGVLIPQPLMIHEFFKILNSPSAGMSYADLGLSLVEALLNPFGYTHVRESGPYKGMNDPEKALYVNSLYLRNVMKFTKDIEYQLNYYNK